MKLGVVAHAYNPRAQEDKAIESQFGGPSGLHRATSNLRPVRPCLKKRKK
jgi:hypothetical protein